MSESDRTSSEAGHGSDADDVKRRFREALDRKNQRHGNSSGHLDGQSKIHSAHRSADHKREFRRKSG
ncbi:hypothetical protein ERC79_03655 [Rhodococcus sp. ABRD24]|uniref:DUF5302 domain-containing protein n=1 Tax=Rhodococcus sp. ABRD24 TaxID=2507582 RepID=UPI0010409D25|nr:DUF5302 domain-containing protein [Rhodococcus sp. ABRD24]QBJ95155.1 hypothetical protein ERC79_03655 [Rhodococcus sp. ABRD24]